MVFPFNHKYIYSDDEPPIEIKVVRLVGGQTIIGYVREGNDGRLVISSPRELMAVPNSDGTTQIVFLPINHLGPMEYAACPALILVAVQYYSCVAPDNAPDLVAQYSKLIFPEGQ